MGHTLSTRVYECCDGLRVASRNLQYSKSGIADTFSLHNQGQRYLPPDLEMTNPANDIVKQATQGSVAAIIQVLNEKLADSGVRTRAILADGVLQLLCEAATVDQLEPSMLIEQVRQTLEAIAPRNIRRVNINSRIVREQQLLWLEEINRDPEGLLWSKEITLKRPNIIQYLFREWQSEKHSFAQSGLSVRSPRQLREQQQFWRGGLVGGATVALLLLLGGVLYTKLASQTAQNQPKSPGALNPAANQINAATTTEASVTPTDSSSSPPSTAADPFASAVRIAEQAAQAGQTARSSQQWRSLSLQWQKASDLMAAVPETDDRYKTAQQKAVEYRQKSASVLQRVAPPQ